jgi:tetratricopeptide (TPR) repeat protein
MLAKHAVDAEEYAEAERWLDQALAVHPLHPEAKAYASVIAYLANDPEKAVALREEALRNWPGNPLVDHLIGAQLSRKYRFAEGADFQRQALRFDPDFLPARMQLAQDQLRLGEEAEGWKLAEEVNAADGYNVMAYNLVTLKEKLSTFRTLTNANFVVRMSPSESKLYGDRVLALLERALATLAAKYEAEPWKPIVVEIFPEQKDFGVRTFGMPDNPGFLGVCFGPVITANSPASSAGETHSWEAVLWHELCHVITLHLTKNRMPRWLSEGISVYEERQASPAWGQAMNPTYRRMILGGDLTPISQLSGAFLTPDSSIDLQFAYYQSYLAVEFIVGRYGHDRLRQILAALGEGVNINEALEAHADPIEELDRAFAEFARNRAEQFGADLDWTEPDVEGLGSRAEQLTRFAADNATNFFALTWQAQAALAAGRWDEAEQTARRLIALCPDYAGENNAYEIAALACRGAGRFAEERLLLEALAELDADNFRAFLRLTELAERERDWGELRRNVERTLAVNPLLPQPYRSLALAGEQTKEWQLAAYGWERLLQFDPPDLAETYFRLAQALDHAGDPSAKRYVLQALEEAPRHLAAHRLLLAMHRGEATDKLIDDDDQKATRISEPRERDAHP